jgi:hypothetical protein
LLFGYLSKTLSPPNSAKLLAELRMFSQVLAKLLHGILLVIAGKSSVLTQDWNVHTQVVSVLWLVGQRRTWIWVPVIPPTSTGLLSSLSFRDCIHGMSFITMSISSPFRVAGKSAWESSYASVL